MSKWAKNHKLDTIKISLRAYNWQQNQKHASIYRKDCLNQQETCLFVEFFSSYFFLWAAAPCMAIKLGEYVVYIVERQKEHSKYISCITSYKAHMLMWTGSSLWTQGHKRYKGRCRQLTSTTSTHVSLLFVETLKYSLVKLGIQACLHQDLRTSLFGRWF